MYCMFKQLAYTRMCTGCFKNTFKYKENVNIDLIAVTWPARSPDLYHLQFYLWSHLRRLVYTAEISDEEILHLFVLGDPTDKHQKDCGRVNVQAMELVTHLRT